MKKFSLFLVAFSTIFFLSQTALAVSIDILNPSFEEEPEDVKWLNHVPGPYFTDILDWTISEEGIKTGTSTWQPTEKYFLEDQLHGSNVAALNSGYISQILTEQLTIGYMYTLGAWIGNRPDLDFPGYSVELWAGDYFLAKEDSLEPEDGEFLLSSLTYSAPEEHEALGEFLTIKLWSEGVQINFENVILDASLTSAKILDEGQFKPDSAYFDGSPAPVPEPATIFLLGTGLFGLASLGRKKWIKKKKDKGQGYKAKDAGQIFAPQ
jgi:hypothetical protein